MTDPLRVYLHDHRAGATFALELLEQLVKEHADEPLGSFARALRSEVQADVRVLEGIIARLGLEGAGPAKQVVAWLGEKASRLKLRRAANRGLGTLLVLETLSLGVLGKLALWQAMADVAARDGSLHGIDFRRLADRARAQHARLEERRLEAARTVLDVDEEGRRAWGRRRPSGRQSGSSLRTAALVAVAVAIPAAVLLTGARTLRPAGGEPALSPSRSTLTTGVYFFLRLKRPLMPEPTFFTPDTTGLPDLSCAGSSASVPATAPPTSLPSALLAACWSSRDTAEAAPARPASTTRVPNDRRS